MSWHLTEQLAQGYVDGDVRGARAASVEAHVLTCDICQSMVGKAAPTSRLQAIWSEVEEEVDAPRSTWVERLLTRLRLPDTDARLVAAAPSLHASWLDSLVAVLAFAAWASNVGGRGLMLFLIIAPLVPVAAVAGAYGPRIDPTYEFAAASPYPGFRLVLLRACAVVLTSGALAVIASAFVPDARVAAAWMLPCLALVSLALALARWLPLPVSAGAVGAAYALPLLTVLYVGDDVVDVVQSGVLQVVAAAVALAALMVMTTDPQLRAALRRNP